jgi:hypothetical protein
MTPLESTSIANEPLQIKLRRLACLRCLCVLSFRSLFTYLHEGGMTRGVHRSAWTQSSKGR